MPELLWAQGRVCRNFCGLRKGYAGAFLDSRGGMTEFLWAQGAGYTVTFVGSGGGGYAGTCVGLGGVCQNFWRLREGYAGTFVSLRGGMPEPLWALGGYAELLGA